MRIIDLKELITNSKNYEKELVSNMLDNIVKERLEKEELEKQNKDREFELEKTRLQLKSLKVLQGNSGPVAKTSFSQNFQKLMPKCNLQTDERNLFLEIFERQEKVMQIPKERWVSYLISVLPTEMNNFIAREPEEEARECAHVKSLSLKRFKLSTIVSKSAKKTRFYVA